MNKKGCLNWEMEYWFARLGHTQQLVICDSGLPIPEGKKVIDLALVPGTPSFLQVLKVVSDELVIESYLYADEIVGCNKSVLDGIKMILSDKDGYVLSHDELKKMSLNAEVFIRTGECSSYANVILTAGVNF